MRIYCDERQRVRVKTSLGDLSLAEAAIAIRHKENISVSALERRAGLDHPRWDRIEKGKSESLRAFIIGADALGYEIEVKR